MLAVFAVIVGVFARLMLPGAVAQAQTSDAFQLSAFLSAYRPLLRDPKMLAIYAAVLTRAACWMGVIVYLGAFLHSVYGADARMIGWVYMIGGGSFFLGTVMAGGQLSRFALRPLVAVGLAFMAILIGVAYGIPVGLMQVVALLAVVALFASVTAAGLNAMLAEETPAGKATTMGLNSAMFGFGSGIGAGYGGALIALGGYPAFGLGLSGLLLISIFLVWRPRAISRPATRGTAAGPGRSAG